MKKEGGKKGIKRESDRERECERERVELRLVPDTVLKKGCKIKYTTEIFNSSLCPLSDFKKAICHSEKRATSRVLSPPPLSCIIGLRDSLLCRKGVFGSD